MASLVDMGPFAHLVLVFSGLGAQPSVPPHRQSPESGQRHLFRQASVDTLITCHTVARFLGGFPFARSRHTMLTVGPYAHSKAPLQRNQGIYHLACTYSLL